MCRVGGGGEGAQVIEALGQEGVEGRDGGDVSRRGRFSPSPSFSPLLSCFLHLLSAVPKSDSHTTTSMFNGRNQLQ